MLMLRLTLKNTRQSLLPLYAFSKDGKGFDSFRRNKKLAGNHNIPNGKHPLPLNTHNAQQQQPSEQQKKEDTIQGFSSFANKTNKKPFNKELFQKMRREAELTKPPKDEKSKIEDDIQDLGLGFQKRQEKKNTQEEEEPAQQTLRPETKRLRLLMLGFGLAASSALYLFYKLLFHPGPPEIAYSELVEMVKEGQVKEVMFSHDINSKVVQVNIRSAEGQFYRCVVEEEAFVANMISEYNRNNNFGIVVHSQTNHNSYLDKNKMKKILILFLNVGLLWIFFKAMGSSKGLQAGTKGNSKSMFQMEEAYGREKKMRKTVNVRFKDVAGMSTPKKEITEFVEFLKHPEKFKKLGARIPRGALLTGPPGTGKTLLAKACAGEAKVSFFSTSGSEFVEKFVGVGAARVRQLFKEAKASAPSIIFIDEIDAVGRKRWKHAIGGNDERDSTLNQLLVEMDGFGTQENVVVFAATNRKEMLDEALLRPGRFDRIIEIELPDLEERYQMFLVHLNPIKLATQIQNPRQVARRMAMLTPGFSGADIFNVCNEAAILAARDSRGSVSMLDFESACDRIVAGSVKRNTLNEYEKKIVAFHESGHGVVSWFLEGANPLLKLTITPRSKGSLGFAQYLPTDKRIVSRDNMVDQIAVMLGGRATEESFFGKLTSGAADDLQRASELASRMIKEFGMGATLFNKSSSQTEYMKEYSEYTASKIDKEVNSLVLEAFSRAKALVQKHKEKIRQLAELLLKQQNLNSMQIQEILGIRPFEHSESYKNFISKV